MPKTFNIADYGAVSQGALCTAQIQHAIDDCFQNGGGEVIIPEGTFLTGGLRLRSRVTLHLMENAVLLGSIDPEDYCTYLSDSIEPISEEERTLKVSTAMPQANGASVYPYSRWNNAIIRAIHARDIAIIGEKGSEINGQNCYDPLGEANFRGPHAINMWFCENITLEGYTIRDSANWAHAIQNSQNIQARNITVLAGHDGLNIRTCDHTIIENCSFLTGDDSVAGFDNKDVIVRNCYFESACSIFRFGGTDVLIEDCRGIAPATYGFRLNLSDEEKRTRASSTASCRHNCLNVFLYYCDYRANIRHTPGNILVRNCVFDQPDRIVSIPFGHMWTCNRSLHDITFENCTFNGVCQPMELKCPEEEPLTLYMTDCSVTARSGYEQIPFIEGENVKALHLTNIDYRNFEDPRIITVP